MKYFSYLLFLLVITACNSVPGNKMGNKNESKVIKLISGSIVYQPVLLCDSLSFKVNEQSGMLWYNNLFWVNNNSDCEPKLYAYNNAGQIETELEITNAKNIDWEALADDKDYIYIGDFGNNYGDRKNLRVLRLAKSEIEKKTKVEIEEIGIEWTDQEDFSRRKQNHDFDCEAFLSYGDSLYYFTKNWANLKTRMYVSSKKAGHENLKPKAEFNVDMLVTGADISSDGKLLALVGYKNYLSYLMLFSEFEGTDFFGGECLRIDMSPLGGVQTEGVVFGENDSLYISTEETKLPQSLYKLEWEQWKEKLK